MSPSFLPFEEELVLVAGITGFNVPLTPYGTGICCYAFIYIFFIAFVHSFFIYFFLKSVIDKSMEWSTIPVCPSLMCFFKWGDTEGANS